MDLVKMIFFPIDCFGMTDDYSRFSLASYFDIQLTEKGFCL